MLTIWGRQNSSNVRKVVWCCVELDVPFERRDIGGAAGGLDSPEYRRLNPNRVIPTIEHDGFVLWESNAIVRYIASTFGFGTLYPEDLRERADADRWMDWQVTTLRPVLIPPVLDWIYGRPMDQNQCRRAEPIWRILDEHLVGRSYLVGSGFTMADIPIALMAHWWFEFAIIRPAMPHLERWYCGMCERPAFQSHVLARPYGPPEDH